jgi:membrane protein implicated in regulation of membrane protease activity
MIGALLMPFYVWLTIAILFTLIEIFTSGFFYACFAAGAIAAWATSLLTESATLQIVVFCVVSVGLIPITRLFARKVTDESVPQAGADALIGQAGVVTEAIKPLEDTGKVRVDGQEWRATSDGKLTSGAQIVVVAVKGAKLLVKPMVR